MTRKKAIGIVGGLSWESTALYYRLLNETAEARQGAQRNARSIIVTVEFREAADLARAGKWTELGALLVDAARQLERAGAACVLLSANTAHAVADAVEAAIAIPLIHIADTAAAAIRKAGHRRVGLIGTPQVMMGDFYRKRLADRHGTETLIPGDAARAKLETIIFDELTTGLKRPDSQAAVLEIVADLGHAGAEGVVVGCTELPLILDQRDTAVALYDTVRLHVEAALDFAAA